jgi:hypothetical protein
LKIIYKQQSEDKRLTFWDVKENQLFVAANGCLYQKYSDEKARMVANHIGMLCCGCTEHFEEMTVIQRLIPEIEKIEF